MRYQHNTIALARNRVVMSETYAPLTPRRFKPYFAYRPSGVEWLGDVPAHWAVRRIKTIFREVDERAGDVPGELLSLTRAHGLIPQVEASNRIASVEDLSSYKICRPGFMVMNRMQAWSGMFAVSTREGLISPDYCIFGLADSFEVTYFEYLFKTSLMVGQFAQKSKGIGSGFNRLYTDDFGSIPSFVPPPSEQAGIVRYLDHVDRRIRRYVAAKQKLIALLEEERKNATLEAIQSPDAISHRIGVVADLVERPIGRASDETYTPIGLYNRGRGIFRKEPRSGDDLGDSNFFWVERGDLVISGQFAWEGAVALASDIEHGCVASHRYPVLRGKPNVLDTGFLLAFFQTDWGQLLLDYHSRGAAGRNRPLNAGTLMKEKISLPPLESQRRIVEMLQHESQVRRQVKNWNKLLNEYRTRLIADVVTGKLDVREAAAQLPEGAGLKETG